MAVLNTFSQVTTDKGFHILDERALKEVIDVM
jgi:hypothetical protein